MPLLPPNHVTLPFAATYLAAAILHDNHSPDSEKAPAPFNTCSLTVDRHAQVFAPNGLSRLPLPRVQRHVMVSRSLRVHASSELASRDPAGFEVSVTFAELNGQSLYMGSPGSSPSAIKNLELTLAPPVVGCLSSTRLRAGLNARGLIAVGAPLPNTIQVYATSFEERLVTRYRQVLATGSLKAVLVDGKGRSKPIPASHWREDGTSAALVDARPLPMTLDGQDVRGHVCVDLSVLRARWRNAFAALPPSTELAEAELPAFAERVGTAPLLDFAVYLARELGIIDGRGPDGLPINQGTLEGLIEDRWADWGKLEGLQSTNRLKLLASILRNPNEKTGPKEWSTLGS